MRNLFILFLCGLSFVACSEQTSLYEGLAPEEDGVLAVAIDDDDEAVVVEEVDTPDEPVTEIEEDPFIDVYGTLEKNLINRLHDGEVDKLSFLVVHGDSGQVVKSLNARVPRRLASVTKVFTGLAALDEVNGVEIPKVARMLKSSNNAEASRYVRLAAKAIADHTTTGSRNTQAASCPSSIRNDRPAAQIVMDWWRRQMTETDWTDASILDGAGCDYGNFMTLVQIVEAIEFADSRGNRYGGQSFEDLLSISGVDGTWRNRNRDAKGLIFAKTGTLRPNSNLAGMFYARKKNQMQKYYFAVMVQKKGSGEYTTKSRQMIEGLLRGWVDEFATPAIALP